MATGNSTSPAAALAQPASPQPSAPAELLPATRRLRVGHLCRDLRPRNALTSTPTQFPFLRLGGRWLDQVGFGVGATVQVSAAPGRLVLEVVGADTPPRTPLMKRGAR